MKKYDENFQKGFYDKMIDEMAVDTNNKLSRIMIDTHNRIGKKAIHSECLLKNSHLGECNQLIDAHSIQNNGIINRLSKGDSIVSLDNLNDLGTKSLLTGKNEATIFRGFCKKHDEIFQPIERLSDSCLVYGDNKPLQNYLFAYRAFSKRYIDSKTSNNYFMKFISDFVESEQLESTLEKHNDVPINSKEIREAKKQIVKKRQNFRIQELKKLLEDNDRLKRFFNTNLSKERYYKIQTLELDLKIKNVMACSSTIDIITDFNGDLFNKDFKYPIFLTIFPNGDTTKVLISYLKTHSTYLERIISPLKDSPVEQQEIILSNILIKKADNIIYNPIEFNKFSEKSIDIIRKYNQKRTQHPREPLVTINLNAFRPQ